jgi:hypothetical protein
MNRETFIETLRKTADFFESHPQLGAPVVGEHVCFSYYGSITNDGRMNVDSKEGLAYFVHAVGGKVEKRADETFYDLTANPIPHLYLTAKAYRGSVCAQVKVGEKVVPEHVEPAMEAVPERVVPEHVEDILEWKCPLILAPEEKDAE